MSCSTKSILFDSPSKLYTDSCFSTESLRRIAETYNKYNPTTRIPKRIINGNRSELIKTIRSVFHSRCSKYTLPHHNDSCILQTHEGKHTPLDDIERDAPPPPAPDNKLLTGKPWNTYELDIAMKFVEKRFPHFIFIEPTPLDFDAKDDLGQCMVSELCNFDIRSVEKEGKTSFGVIYNTHTSDKPGGHWICTFCCLKSGRICYYDSYGFLPEKEILVFMKRMADQYESYYKRPMKLLYNDFQNQKDGVECGTFCILFLSEMTEHGDMRRAVHNIRNDTIAKARRKFLLSPMI